MRFLRLCLSLTFLFPVTLFAAAPKPFPALKDEKITELFEDSIHTWNKDKALRIDLKDFQKAFTDAVKKDYVGTEWDEVVASLTKEAEKIYRDQLADNKLRAAVLRNGFGPQLESVRRLLRDTSVTSAFSESKFAEPVGSYFRERSEPVPPDTVIAVGTATVFDSKHADGFALLPSDAVVTYQDEIGIPVALVKGYQGKLEKIDLQFQVSLVIPFGLLAKLLEAQFKTANIVFINKHTFEGRAEFAESVVVHELRHLVDFEFRRVGTVPRPNGSVWANGGDEAWKKLQAAQPKEFAAYLKSRLDEAMRYEKRPAKEVEAEVATTIRNEFLAQFEMMTIYYRNHAEIRAYQAESDYLIKRYRYDRKRYEASMQQGYWFTPDQKKEHDLFVKKLEKDAPPNPTDAYFEAWHRRARAEIFAKAR